MYTKLTQSYVSLTPAVFQLYSSTTGELVSELRKSRYGGMAIMCMRFHPKAHHILLASTSDGKIFSCNTDTGAIEEFASGIQVTITNNKQFKVTVQTIKITLINPVVRGLLQISINKIVFLLGIFLYDIYLFTEKDNEINCLDFDFDGLHFATGGRDLSIRIYNSKTGQVLLHLEEICFIV